MSGYDHGDSPPSRSPAPGARAPCSNPFDDDQSAYDDTSSVGLNPQHSNRRFQLSDSYSASMASLPTGSTYSLAEGGEKEYGEEFRGGPDEEENQPLRQDRQDYGGESWRNRYGPESGRGLLTPISETQAWQARQRVNPKRGMTKKVKLTPQGNYIVEHAVPTAVKNANLSSGVQGEPTEFTHMRYTAACCDADDFTKENGYSLRASNYGRQTDLLVCITAYNENKILLARTLHALMVNIRDMVKGSFSEFRKNAERQGGGEEGRYGEAWKRIVVCLVFDGIEPADKGALDVLALIGLFQDGLMKKDVDGNETVCHIFEYTTQLSMSEKPALIEPHPNDPNNLVPVQMIFCLKQKNAKKINSHRWLFNAVGSHLHPEVVCLLDAGTKPGRRSIYYLWEAFYHNKDLGGACGEIHAMLGKKGKKLRNPLVAAQNFEYKISNILDKPLESAFGYVSVLPGAFSCYRFAAIQGRPLTQYFHGDHSLAEKLGPKGINGMSIWTKNMFLAEDRILCFELVAKANERWVLGYVKPAKGETDVPESAAELIGQRRRWLNGSFAAGVYALANFGRLYQSDHGVIRLFFLHVQAIYNTVQLVMSWFSVANFFLTFSIITRIVGESLRFPAQVAVGDEATTKCWAGSFIDATNNPTSFDFVGELNWIFNVIYLGFLALQVILALGNRPKAEKLTYTISIAVYAFFQVYLVANTVELTIKAFCPLGADLSEARLEGKSSFTVFFNGAFAPIFAGLAGTLGIYVIASVLYLDPWHLFHSMPQYLLISASFTNILNVYAFFSWGTKGSDSVAALPSANVKKEGKEAIVEIHEKVQEGKITGLILWNRIDIDSTFKATVIRAITPEEEEEEVVKPTLEDLDKTFRTRFICAWLFMNAILAITISRTGSNVQTRYFQAILWITFGLAFVRFSGLMWYLCGESVFRLGRLISRRR
ncbi:chitin synthase [Meredithblackwellia eburnea MCA 4105]